MQVSLTCSQCDMAFLREKRLVRSDNQFCSQACANRFIGAAKRAKEAAAFWTKVRQGRPDECWEWTGYRMPYGYGQVGWNRKILLAHRVALSLTDGDWASQGLVCHSCDNPPCCNPAHLWRGDYQDNNDDKKAKSRERYVASPGQQHGRSKLTDSDVIEIRKSTASRVELAAKYGVTKGHINQIKSRLLWRHLP